MNLIIGYQYLFSKTLGTTDKIYVFEEPYIRCALQRELSSASYSLLNWYTFLSFSHQRKG